MSDVVLLTGPPGSGKTTLARRMCAASTASKATHLHTDDAYHGILKGFIDPNDPASNEQNTVIANAIAASAAVYAEGGYEVWVDGIIGPWFLDVYRERLANCRLHYIVLSLPLETARQRAAERTAHPITDYPDKLHAQLADLGELAHHALPVNGLSIEAARKAVRHGVENGTFTLPPLASPPVSS